MKHILNQIFDKIFLINLDRREDRWIECKKSLDSHGIEVERLSAVDGLELGEEQLNYQMLNYIPESNLRGQHGCIMSHFKGISLAKERNYKNVLMLEDDFELCDDFENEFKSYYPQVPNDWELLYLGANHNFHQGLNLPMISKNVGKPIKSYTTHAYAAKDSLYDSLLGVFNIKASPVDVSLCSLQAKMDTCYAIQPSIITQADGYSDIMNQDISYKPYIK